MLARVTTWEGGTADGIRTAAERMRADVSQGPPEGLKSTGFTLLVNPEASRVVMLGLFESEQDLRDSEAVLAQMSPPAEIGQRTGVEVFEVGVEVRM